MKRREDLRDLITAARELHAASAEASDLMMKTAMELRSARGLFGQSRGASGSSLVKFGIALIAFPEPFVSDLLGSGLVTVGLALSKLRSRNIYVDDVVKTVEGELEELMRASGALQF